MSDLPDAASVILDAVSKDSPGTRGIIAALLAHGGPSGVTITSEGQLVPAGLSEGEQELVSTFRAHFPPIDPDSPVSFDRHVVDTLLNLIESRLAPPVDDRDKEGEDG